MKSDALEIPTPAEWLMADVVVDETDAAKRDIIIALIMEQLGEADKEVGLACCGVINLNCRDYWKADTYKTSTLKILGFVRKKLSAHGWDVAFNFYKKNSWSSEFVLQFKLYTVKRTWWQSLIDTCTGYNN